jgi:hypothetical protein
MLGSIIWVVELPDPPLPESLPACPSVATSSLLQPATIISDVKELWLPCIQCNPPLPWDSDGNTRFYAQGREQDDRTDAGWLHGNTL